MNNLTYVAIESAGYDGENILYAGNEIEIARTRIRESCKRYEMSSLEYSIYVWENGEVIKSYIYDEEEDVFFE